MSVTGWLRSLPALLPRLQSGDPCTVVMGNEACDLDSGVSALCLSYHRSTQHTTKHTTLPLLNINSEDFPLKTELVSVLAEEGIHQNDLLFRDTLDLTKLDSLSLVVVDHNILTETDKDLQGRVVEIIDHHARETQLQEGVTIEPVGSCASLVLRTILSENPNFGEKSCLRMLRKTILLDTVCLRPEAKRVTDTDIDMIQKVEALLDVGQEDREEVFQSVMKEKSRVDHLTPGQLLRRDLKIVSRECVRVALCSVPVLCKDFIHKQGWAQQVEDFMLKDNYCAVVILGFHLDDTGVTRDLLVGGTRTEVVDVIRNKLENNKDPCLELHVVTNGPEELHGFRLYRQANQAASRKQILPLVKAVVI